MAEPSRIIGSQKFAGVRQRLRLLENIAQGAAYVEIDTDAIPINQSSATWFQTASNRMTLLDPVLNDSDIDWISLAAASDGDYIDVDTIALAPGRYKVTFNLHVLNGGAAAVDYKYALTDDGTAHDGDGGETALATSGEVNFYSTGALATDQVFISRVHFLDLANDSSAQYNVDSTAESVANGHLLYFCAANDANTTAPTHVPTHCYIVIERLG